MRYKAMYSLITYEHEMKCAADCQHEALLPAHSEAFRASGVFAANEVRGYIAGLSL